MIFSVLLIVLVVAIAYFHWVQGVLGGVVSMTLAILAGTLAVGYHEWAATALLGGKFPDMGNALMLCVIFAAVYGIGRIVFDMFIPNNVRVPLYFDRVGGLLCGLVAGIFGVGTIAIAAQSMPFDTSILGFSRYPIADDKNVTVVNTKTSRTLDAVVSGTLDIEGDDPAPKPDKEAGLLLPVDSMLVDFTTMQSRSGALAGGRSFSADHPNLLRELTLARGGLQTGSKHSAINLPGGRQQVKLVSMFAPRALYQSEGEITAIRSRKLPAQLAADPTKPGKMVLIVRVAIDRSATEADGKLRFSTGSTRLVVNGETIYPTGTMHYPGNVLLANHVDDILLATAPPSGTPTIDFAFNVNRDDVAAAGADDGLKIKPGVYLELKRLARVDLSDQPVAISVPTPPEVNAVDRRTTLIDELGKRIAGTAIK